MLTDRSIDRSPEFYYRQFYKCHAPYQVNEWRKKMFIVLFNVFIINSCTLYNEIIAFDNKSQKLRDYREFIGKRLLIFNEDDLVEFERLAQL